MFSFCFNRYVPASKDDLIVVPPGGITFVNGMAFSYREYKSYDERLKPYLSKSEFRECISAINDDLEVKMPCPGLTGLSYLLAIPTLGLTLLLAWLCCVRRAENDVREIISDYNREKFAKKNIDFYPYCSYLNLLSQLQHQ